MISVLLLILRWIATICCAFIFGKIISKIKLPSILGWLIAGMIFGPYSINLLPTELLNTRFYNIVIHVLECCVGLMIGTELVWNKIKKNGIGLIVTTLMQSLGTFFFVSLCFFIVFYFSKIPLYLAFIFGGIALATAPAPALSIVGEFKTKGCVTQTLIPMAALDDIVGVVVFFTTISIIARHASSGSLSFSIIPMMIFLPLIIGVAVGIPCGIILKKIKGKKITFCFLLFFIILTAFIGMICNKYLMPSPLLNFMLMGMAFSAAFSNIVTEERLAEILSDFNPFLGFSMIVVILNLGAPLDYHSVLGAGLFTFIYIVSRAFGKYFGARFGAKMTGLPITVQKYLGLTLLPHSGVSLVFTGIASSVLAESAPECSRIITGTIAAAAVINEIIAVIVAKKGFELAGEFNTKKH